MASSPFLSCYNLSMSFGSSELFTNLSFSVHPGERIGIVGANGAGKTTLFRIISGQITPNTGQVALRTGIRCAVVEQEFAYTKYGQISVSEFLTRELPPEFNLDKQRKDLEHEILLHAKQVEQNPEVANSDIWVEKLTVLQDALNNITGAGVQNIIDSALRAGRLLHLAHRLVSELSGGEQKRLQIIATLLQNPQLIFLDEPTNHLDLETVEWLESFLLDIVEQGNGLVGGISINTSAEPCSFVIISHDRALLDTLVNKIMEIDRGVCSFFEGNFEFYTEECVKRSITVQNIRDRTANLFKRELAWLRAGTKARTTKQTARIDRALSLGDKLQQQNVRLQNNTITSMEFMATMEDEVRNDNDSLVPILRPLGEQELIKLKKTSICHPAVTNDSQLICKDLTLTLKPRMRVALIGHNGCGKSTLLQYIAEGRSPFAGDIVKHELGEIVYFAQNRQSLNPAATVRETLCPKGDYVSFSGRNVHIMAYLDQFLFSKYDANRSVAQLSGGEQARLLLASLMLASGNILLLDEPTNDLDIPTLQMLEKSIVQFNGGVIFTSHDRYFIQRVATHVLVYAGEFTVNNCRYADWKMCADLDQALEVIEQAQLKQEELELLKARALSKAANAFEPKKNKISFNDKRELEKIEAQIASCEEIIAAKELELSELYSSGAKFEQTSVCEKEIKKQQKKLEELMPKWEMLFAKS